MFLEESLSGQRFLYSKIELDMRFSGRHGQPCRSVCPFAQWIWGKLNGHDCVHSELGQRFAFFSKQMDALERHGTTMPPLSSTRLYEKNEAGGVQVHSATHIVLPTAMRRQIECWECEDGGCSSTNLGTHTTISQAHSFNLLSAMQPTTSGSSLSAGREHDKQLYTWNNLKDSSKPIWHNPKDLCFFLKNNRMLSLNPGHPLHENQRKFVWRTHRNNHCEPTWWTMGWHQRTANCQKPSHCAFGGFMCAPTTEAALRIRQELLKRGTASWTHLFSETALLGLLGLP